MARTHERLETGQKIRDTQTNNVGVILDFACQYAHPKADPVYSYLVRWQDGQVQALTEFFFKQTPAYEIID